MSTRTYTGVTFAEYPSAAAALEAALAGIAAWGAA